MKKFMGLCMCLLLVAAMASAERVPFNFDQPQQLKAAPDWQALTQGHAARLSQLNALQEQILARKAAGQNADDLWAQYKALHRELDRTPAGNLDQGGDNCADAVDLGSTMGGNFVSGSTVGFNNDYGPYGAEPECWQGTYFMFENGSESTQGPDVTYKWTTPYSGIFTFSVCSPNLGFDSCLELYHYTCENGEPSYPGDFICGNDDACDLGSTIECIPLAAGQEILIVVDGYGQSAGNYDLSIRECACEITCPPEAIRSQEAPCFDGLLDVINGGCYAGDGDGRGDDQLWEELGCNATICGTAGNHLDPSGNPGSDEDWYRVVIEAPTQLTYCITAEGANGIVGLFQGPCPVGEPLYVDNFIFCEENCFSYCLEPGEYFIAVVLFNTDCGTPYVLSTSCEPCDLCEDPEFYLISTSHGLPTCLCVTVCEPGTIHWLCVGPLGPDEYPIGTYEPGCLGGEAVPGGFCEEECPPTSPIPVGPPFYDEERQLWCLPFGVEVAGCFCLCIDDILPVELNGFEAIAGDAEVSLSWSTASESELDRFEILRDGSVVAAINATNASSGHDYSWRDRNLANGRQYSYSLVAVALTGTREEMAVTSATPSVTSATVTEYALHQNYPNPFNPSTEILFDIKEAGNVTLTVYNPLGQTVATLVNGNMQAGRHTVGFDAATLTSGLYFYRLEAGDFTAVRKMVLMK